MADIDPILDSKDHKKDMRIFLNFELKSAGIFNAIIEFKE